MSDEALKHALELIGQDRQEREQACAAELAELLQKHHCVLAVVTLPIEELTIHLSIVVRAW